MPFLDAVRLALAQIRVQKLKSFFTLLGVTIGVMFLIAVVSIVEGMGTYMERDLVGKIMGINTFELRHRPYVQLGDVDESEWRSWRSRPRITDQDIRPVTEVLPEGTRWYVESLDNITIESKYARPRNVEARAVTGEYFAVKNLAVTSGRLFNPFDHERANPVVVIGKDVAEHFFPTVDPIGRELKVGGLPYTVVGVAEAQGSTFGVSFDRFVIAPYETPMKRLLNRQRGVIDAIVVQAPSAEAMAPLQEQVRQVMRSRHKLRPAQKDDFSISTSASALEFWNKLKGYLVIAGIALPAIGLVVGAIVIMNIMLVAVAERTREIGIRKSLGARRRDILAQFLVESATLSTFGAAIGIGLGVAMATVIRTLSPLPTTVAPWSVVVAVALGAGVGVLAGVYPASRAARLDPITALRSE
ncbi:MAG: ABC transporter permease [Gemmatimonadaceae bacterium]